MIELTNLTKVYRKVYAVHDLCLRVERGALFGFIGPNGAGKTTTIKMMAGVLRPTSGRITIGGFDLAADPVGAKQRVGYIPDRPFVYEKLTGREFLAFMAGLYRVPRGAALQAVMDRLLERFDLTGWQDELIEGYSHGMKQRLALCAALVHAPEVLIVDEPMVGLDPRGARLLKDLLREESAGGTTIFMSTHSLEVAQEVCDEVAIIQMGRIIARGTSEDLARAAGVDGGLEETFLTLTEERLSNHAGSPAAA